MPSPFSIRDAVVSSHDAQFIADAFDSTIPHLTAAGNAAQWGTEPMSRRSGFHKTINDSLEQSERFRESGDGERVRVFIAEVEDDQDVAAGASTSDGLARRVDEHGRAYVAVGVAKILDEHFKDYVLEAEVLKPSVNAATEAGNFVFLDMLVTDHRVGNRRKGAGDALIQKTKEYAAEHGRKSIWLDCYAGGKLVQYYVSKGFTPVAAFDLPRPQAGIYKGQLLRMDLA
ncbi:hypothetical protein FZEAL_1047 [Fusarium zealandicum]|uniref:N-acetyltransferase domain-containing protein n=1 Tax=Fusarium zealandicum TaxID=1053134 RepID=A0A8H4XPR1_9HYPO|nr:hypothetical protein FZEAL_1047 [Fusarium zealandicum]